jgi:hypothetical protein
LDIGPKSILRDYREVGQSLMWGGLGIPLFSTNGPVAVEISRHAHWPNTNSDGPAE